MFGDRLKLARKKANMTQKEVAEALGVTFGTISNWEKSVSNPDVNSIDELCKCLGISPNFLFDDEYMEKVKKESPVLDKATMIAAELYYADEETVDLVYSIMRLHKEQKKTIITIVNSFLK